MNIVHVRDTMKLVHKEGRIDSLRLHALLHAPVFVYDLAATDDAFNLNEEQTEWGKENLIGKDGRFRLPYVMSNTNAVVRVSPKPSPGKSIEWQLARTHYCLLTKKQAMQVRDVRRPITDHDIKRAAHWRRAHFRRLTSERFTHKRGQLVPVAEAWVGPEEWIGLDGKIYKVFPQP